MDEVALMKPSLEIRDPEPDDIANEIDRLLGLETGGNDQKSSYRISDLAREFDVTLRTLRFYEDRGLLTPERRGTTRIYSRRDRARLRLIQLAKVLGFSLTEAKQIIDVYDQPGGERRQLEVALDRMTEQRKVLLGQQEEIERALHAMDVSLAVVKRQLGALKD